jgi:hypothetical protein
MTIPLPRYAVPALMLLALALRLIAFEMHPISETLYTDMNNYRDIADAIGRGEWEPAHFLPAIGYSLIVALIKRLFTDWATAVGLYHVLLSTATIWLVWKAATRAFGPTAGMLSLLVAAVHVPWIVLATVNLSETTFTFQMALLVWAGLEVVERPSVGWSVLWGVIFVSAFWVKGTHVFLGPLFLGAILMLRRWSRDTIVKVAVPISTVVAAGLLAHGVLTYRTIGTFRMSAFAGGLNFIEGKCPDKRNIDSTGSNWLSPVYAQLGMTSARRWDRPFTDSSYYMQEGLKCIQRDPAVLLVSLENVPFLFTGNFLWPATQFSIRPYVRLYELFFGPALIAGLAMWGATRTPWRRERWPEVIVWALPLLALCITVYVFKSEIRFRVPFDVWCIPLAVSGWLTALGQAPGSRFPAPGHDAD